MAQQLSNQRIAWFNGKFMPENQVLIPFRDRSWKYGDGAFDMTRTFNGRAFRLKEHIDRFYRSLRYLRLDPGMSPQELIDVSEQIVARNEHLRGAAGDWWIGQRVSRGVDPIGDEVPEHSGPNVVVECTPLPLKARARQFRDGLDVWTPAQPCIAGLRSFNGAKIGDGRARGPITKRLTDAYIAEVGCDLVQQYLDRLS